MTHSLKVRSVPGRYAVSRLAANSAVPLWLNGSGFRAAIYSDDELTIVCLQERVPDDVLAERDWICLRTIGPFPFDAAGIVQSLIAPLSANEISVFVVCTYDGEHVLVPERSADKAVSVLKLAGHTCEVSFHGRDG